MAHRLTRALLVVTIAAGAWLRFDGLARRPLWYDEAATLLHASGRSEASLLEWYDGRPLRRADLLGTPAAAADVVAAARVDEPQSGPAYFLLVAAWRRVVGPSVAGLRALSALASVLALAAAATLAWRLFGDVDRALAVAALVALSPLHLRYAAEARPYALWTLALLAWMLATLHAAATDRRRAWVGQVAALVAALAVHPLTMLALPAVVALAPGRRMLAASGIGVSLWAILSAPAWSNGAAMGRTTAWVGEPAVGADLARGWLGAVTSVFFRPGGEGGLLGDAATSSLGLAAWVVLGLGALGLVVASLGMLGSAPPRTRRCVGRLVLVPWAVLAAVDLVVGGRRSAIARYLLPAWLGCELAVGRWLGRGRARAGLVVVLALAAATAARTRGTDAWWDTDPPRLRQLAAIAAVTAARPAAIVLADAPPTAVVELAHALGDDVTIRLGPGAPARIGPGEWERVVVALASPELVAAARREVGAGRVLAPLGDAPAAYVVEPGP